MGSGVIHVAVDVADMAAAHTMATTVTVAVAIKVSVVATATVSVGQDGCTMMTGRGFDLGRGLQV